MKYFWGSTHLSDETWVRIKVQQGNSLSGSGSRRRGRLDGNYRQDEEFPCMRAEKKPLTTVNSQLEFDGFNRWVEMLGTAGKAVRLRIAQRASGFPSDRFSFVDLWYRSRRMKRLLLR